MFRRLDQGQAGPSSVAVRRHRQAGQLGAGEAVPHPVEDREPGDVRVHGVVQGVAGDLVGRFQPTRDRDGLVGEGDGWQQGPLDLGGQSHPGGPAHPDDRVAVLRLGHHELPDQGRESLQPIGQQAVVGLQHRGVLDGDPEDAEAFGPVHEREPHPGPAPP